MIIIKRGFIKHIHELNEENKDKPLIYFTIPSFDETGLVKHCFTSRQGGVSQGIYKNLNTSLVKDDDHEAVRTNLNTVCRAVGIDYKKLVSSAQTHKDRVRVVDSKDVGKGIIRQSDIQDTDALITNVPGIPLITYYADCVPVFILDSKNKAVGLVHSGWKSTVLKIAAKTLSAMRKSFGTEPRDCLVGIGPSIEFKCFEIGQEVAAQFMEAFSNWKEFLRDNGNGKYNADLWKAVRLTLMDCGVPEENVTESGLCTKCNEDLFFSHRRDQGKTGSLSAIIELLGE